MTVLVAPLTLCLVAPDPGVSTSLRHDELKSVGRGPIS